VCKSGDNNALKHYRELKNNKVFNNTAYRRRLTVSIETLLLEVSYTHTKDEILTNKQTN
jgi:hypothetical protein